MRVQTWYPTPTSTIWASTSMRRAKGLSKAKSEQFRPQAYEDNVRKRMLEQIQRKVEGHEITDEPTEAPETQIIDLMEALKASLAKGGLKGAGAAERRPARRAARAR